MNKGGFIILFSDQKKEETCDIKSSWEIVDLITGLPECGRPIDIMVE
jgi:hypothetical protein